MTNPTGGALATDLDLMIAVASRIDARNDEVRAMLGSFIGQMTSVPASVWGGAAATRFAGVVERWHAESATLQTALARIAETMRLNERTLREAADTHADGIAAATASL
jgi:WXG100 family type VII secretion target